MRIILLKTQLSYQYTYDKSNRLLKAERQGTAKHRIENTYDKEGNILTLKRWDAGGTLEDNFSYQYNTGTNKLRRVSGSVDQFYYDGNGNMIADSLNGTYNISYDHRNLIVQLYYKREVEENERMVLRTFSEFYKYDDAGNRIKKVVMKYTGEAQDPTIEDSGDAPPGWNYELIQHYVRDITGNELAMYNDTTITFWNVYGIDNAGKINYSDDSWNFYLKDHLGSVRCVIDGNGDIISAEYLDMWGYRMTDRSFQSDTTFYKYTGKERDVTTGYDYFGARYYDSRIGRWGQVEPLLDKYPSWSPYNYGLNNPLRLIDVDGRDVRIHGDAAVDAFNYLNRSMIGLTLFMNSDDGSISYSGTALTEQEIMLVEAINSESVVNLYTTDANYIDDYPFAVGVYLGSSFDDNGILQTTQIMNIEHAKVWSKAGGASIGKSVLHEILESYIGATLYPGEAGHNKGNYNEAHSRTVALERPNEFYPIVNHYFETVEGGMIHVKTTLYNPKTKKEYIVFENN